MLFPVDFKPTQQSLIEVVFIRSLLTLTSFDSFDKTQKNTKQKTLYLRQISAKNVVLACFLCLIVHQSSLVSQGHPCRRTPVLLLVFNWNHFEMRLLNLRINFYLLRTYFLILVVFFVLFLLSLRFGQVSPLAFFRWFTATSDRNAESCNRIPSNYCLP